MDVPGSKETRTTEHRDSRVVKIATLAAGWLEHGEAGEEEEEEDRGERMEGWDDEGTRGKVARFYRGMSHSRTPALCRLTPVGACRFNRFPTFSSVAPSIKSRTDVTENGVTMLVPRIRQPPSDRTNANTSSPGDPQ